MLVLSISSSPSRASPLKSGFLVYSKLLCAANVNTAQYMYNIMQNKVNKVCVNNMKRFYAWIEICGFITHSWRNRWGYLLRQLLPPLDKFQWRHENYPLEIVLSISLTIYKLWSKIRDYGHSLERFFDMEPKDQNN